MESFWGFVRDFAAASARSTWADLGTNGLGWIVGFGNPALVTILKATHAPKGQKIANVLSQWKTELRHVAVVYVAIGAMVFSVEMIWRQPQRIRTDAAAIAGPSPHEMLLSPPELPVPAPPRLPKPQLPTFSRAARNCLATARRQLT
jgi:hypothetical protein